MKYFDKFFIITYFILKKLGRDEDAAKFSSMLHTSLIALILIFITVSIFSCLEFFNITTFIDKYLIQYLLFDAFLVFAFYYRYFKLKVNITKEVQYVKLRNNNFKKSVVKYLVFNIVVAILFVVSAIINKNVHG
jgi:hypothetical protein